MTARLGPIALVCIAVATIAAQSGHPPDEAQQQGDLAQPTFITGTHYVRVDVYVTRDGQLIEDLRPDEITLLEDGIPQTVDTFERIVYRAPDPFEPGIEPRTLEASRALAANPRSRLFVVFIDPWNGGYVNNFEAQRRFPVLRTLDGVLGPDDLVAVMTPRMRPQDLSFVRGLRRLAELEGDWFAPYSVFRPDPATRFDETELLYMACFPAGSGELIARYREKLTLDALESLATYLGELREERKAVLLVTNGWPLYTPTQLASGRDGAPPLPVPPIGGRGRPGGDAVVVTERGVSDVGYADRARCEGDRAALAQLDHRRRLLEIIGAANRANVSFYPASARGLTPDTPPPGAGIGLMLQDGELVPDRRSGGRENLIPFHYQSQLRELAEETDGYAIVNTNNLSDGIRRILADSSAYYLIGYESTNPVLDGRYRRITVRVSRPGVEVRARPGYLAAPIARPTDVGRPAEPLVLDPVNGALNRLANTNVSASLRLREAVWVGHGTSAEPAGAFWLAGDLDPQLRRDPVWARGGTAAVLVRTAAGDEIHRTSVEIAALRPAFALRIPTTGWLAPGHYIVRVEVQGADARAQIAESLRVTVPADVIPMGDARLWRRGPSTGPGPMPTADPRFRRTERLRLELPATSDETATARLLDRTGALLPVPAIMSHRHDAAETFDWVIVDITLAPLAPGDYVVEVTQGEASRVTAFRVVP